MIEFAYTIRDGRLHLAHRRIFDAFVSGLKDGAQGVLRVIRRPGRPKTLAQLAYYYAVVLPAIHRQLIADGHECYGVPINQEMADDIVKHFCARLRDGKIVNKRDMTLIEAMEFLDNAIRWAAMTLHIVIPPPTTDGERQL
jgi:hypothetical protein